MYHTTMFRTTLSRTAVRSIQALLVVLTLLTVIVAPAYAQDRTPSGGGNFAFSDGSVRFARDAVEDADLFMQNGRSGHGLQVADDFVIECPIADLTLDDPNHPCNQYNNGSAVIHVSNINDLVLVCPTGDQILREPNHPCNARQSQFLNPDIDDLVLVCPTGDRMLDDPNHPCNQRSSAGAKFEIPKDYVLTCPVGDRTLPDEKHPCNN